jgi:hypothetical protein
MEDTRDREVGDDRLAELLADAGKFFESRLWDNETSGKARDALAKEGLDEKTIRSFGVGYAPVGHTDLLEHLEELGYSADEVVASGLGRISPRGRIHSHFASRIMFPIRDRDGRILGFAGLGTHLGPSWPMWVVSPDAGLYTRSEAVFGLDRAAKRIAATKTAVVVGDCVAVLRAHQDSQQNAVTIHSSGVTPEQIDEMANGIRGGADGLELDLYGVRVESEAEAAAERAASPTRPVTHEPPPHLKFKRMLLVTATALVGINTFTGAPLLAVWVGAHAQGGRVLSLRGVISVLVVLAILEFLLGLALTWLSATYDRITGRPRFAGETSPWQRAKRGDRVQDIRSRFGMSAPERVVAACVVAGILLFEVWFFFLAGSSLPHQ